MWFVKMEGRIPQRGSVVGDKRSAKNFDKTHNWSKVVECNKLCWANKPCRPTKTGADWTPQGRARLTNNGYPLKQLLASLIQLIQLNQLKNRLLMGSNVGDLQRSHGEFAHFTIYKLSKDVFLPQVDIRCSSLHGGEVLGDNRPVR
jgi:hypothetical protein